MNHCDTITINTPLWLVSSVSFLRIFSWSTENQKKSPSCQIVRVHPLLLLPSPFCPHLHPSISLLLPLHSLLCILLLLLTGPLILLFLLHPCLLFFHLPHPPFSQTQPLLFPLSLTFPILLLFHHLIFIRSTRERWKVWQNQHVKLVTQLLRKFSFKVT